MVDELKQRILVVDDNTIGRYTTSRILKYAGFEVMEAASGEEALEMAQQSPDLILLDVNLPDMSGFEVCQRIKSHQQTCDIPVIHLTAQEVKSEAVVAGLEGGADGYLIQPIKSRELIAWIKTNLRVKNSKISVKRIPEASDDFYAYTKDLLCILDEDSRFWRLSNSWEVTLGYPLEHLLGRPFLELVHPDDSQETQTVLAKLKDENITADYVNRCLHQDGSYRWIQWRYYAAKLRIYATAHDITQSKQPNPG
jgi:PAS domain S-box-containing protein